MEILLKNKSSERSQTNYEYVITGNITLGDIINKANEYNHEANIHIREGVDWDKLVKLNKHNKYKHISNEFIDKYRNNKIKGVEFTVVTNYSEIIGIDFRIDYLYYHH